MSSLWALLAFLRQTKPLCGVVENVLGMAHVPHNVMPMEKSAVQVLIEKLDDIGYESRLIELNLDAWHELKRGR